MHNYEKLIEMLEKELKQFAERPEISSNSLEMIDTIVHAIKCMETIMAMRGESAEYSGDYYGASHARGRRRTSRGRYSSEYSGAYSGASDELMRELEQMRENAPENMRYKFDKMIDEMRRS